MASSGVEITCSNLDYNYKYFSSNFLFQLSNYTYDYNHDMN